jgi:hypothetical protein
MEGAGAEALTSAFTAVCTIWNLNIREIVSKHQRWNQTIRKNTTEGAGADKVSSALSTICRSSEHNNTIIITITFKIIVIPYWPAITPQVKKTIVVL